MTTLLLLLPVFAVRPRLFQLVRPHTLQPSPEPEPLALALTHRPNPSPKPSQVRPHMVQRLALVCVMVAIDLGFTNVAVSTPKP